MHVAHAYKAQNLQIAPHTNHKENVGLYCINGLYSYTTSYMKYDSTVTYLRLTTNRAINMTSITAMTALRLPPTIPPILGSGSPVSPGPNGGAGSIFTVSTHK